MNDLINIIFSVKTLFFTPPAKAIRLPFDLLISVRGPSIMLNTIAEVTGAVCAY